MPLYLPRDGATCGCIEDSLFLAGWIRWCELYAPFSEHPDDSWDRQVIPDYGCHAKMMPRLAEAGRYVWSVDMLCRVLARYRDIQQKGEDFNEQNLDLLEPTRTVAFTGRTVNAYRLTEKAKRSWGNLQRDEQTIFTMRFDTLLEGLSEGDALDDPGHSEAQIPTLCPIIEPSENTSKAKLQSRVRAIDLIRHLVNDIQNGLVQPRYRKNVHGSPVKGWDSRLKSYFWPRPIANWEAVCRDVDELGEDGHEIVKAVSNGKIWTAEQAHHAKHWAKKVFEWGGVPQRLLNVEMICAAIQAAMSANDLAIAPMNSGWTKVAAFTSEIAKKI
jgi:hypothetical protein